ncbi:VOC family protein [Sporolactobacillus sp. KGMB 08714]|uniref:VOC family protein n=1 Tax=Sporolactobacillus sp. KGMB 08714 TaxID=3064704 RepID=UPI002FBDA855
MAFHNYPNTFASEVYLFVNNLERSLEFYQKILGLRVLKKEQRRAVFTANGTDPLVTVEQPIPVIPGNPRKAGLYHVALLLPSRADLALILAHLLKEGYPLQGGADHAVSEAVYLADPDGNGIELYHDRPAAQWKWNDGKVFMTTEALDEQILNESGGKEWEGMPEQTIIGHIHLQVADLKASERFYCQGLGFDLVANFGDQADFISTGGYHHHIGLNTWRSKGIPATESEKTGMRDFTLAFTSSEARDAAIERLKAMGAPVTEENGRVMVSDPSNIRIVLGLKNK